jgi:hypothetical protein
MKRHLSNEVGLKGRDRFRSCGWLPNLLHQFGSVGKLEQVTSEQAIREWKGYKKEQSQK